MSIGEIAKLTHSEVAGGAGFERRISNIAPLDTAGAPDISFLESAKYLGELAATRAGACLVAPRFAASAPPKLVVLLTPHPYRAFVAVARALFPSALRPSSLFEARGRALEATVHNSARIEAGVSIDPQAVVGPRAEIGAGTLIGAGATIGPDVRIGRDCAIGPGTTIQHALLGDRVIIHPGARIGQDGFGYLPGRQGHQKIPQTRRVIIQDDVEIGANTAIDRGGTRDTVIGEGTKIDNLVQIGHNCTIGRHCLIVSQVGISGSVTVGDFVVLAGQVGVADHITIGTGAVLGAKAGVITNVPAGARWAGFPAEPVIAWKRRVTTVRRMVERGRKPETAAEGEDE